MHFVLNEANAALGLELNELGWWQALCPRTERSEW